MVSLVKRKKKKHKDRSYKSEINYGFKKPTLYRGFSATKRQYDLMFKMCKELKLERLHKVEIFSKDIVKSRAIIIIDTLIKLRDDRMLNKTPRIIQRQMKIELSFLLTTEELSKIFIYI